MIEFYQERITSGQRGRLQVQALGYVNSTKVIFVKSLERKSVFGIKANLDLKFWVNSIKWRTEWRLVLSMKMTS